MALSEQPRTGLIANLARLLRGVGFEPTTLDIADLLWLAGYLDAPPETAKTVTKIPDEIKPKEPPLSLERRDDIQHTDAPESGASYSRPPKPRAVLYGSGHSGLSITTPGGTALPGKLGIGRAIRPLMQRVPSLDRFELDEEATAQRIADGGSWLPVLQPTPERWLELDLVVDEWRSMSVWQPVINELRQFLEQCGAFRSVRTWGLETAEAGHGLRLHAGLQANKRSWRSPKELIEVGGNRLILVLSDCISPAWYEGQMGRLISTWGKSQMVTLVQMLPERLWPRSGLGDAIPLWLRARTPGTPNNRLQQRLSWDYLPPSPAQGFPVPVMTLEPEMIACWAKLMVGKDILWTPGFLLPMDDTIEKQRQADIEPTPEPSPAERLNIFRSLASPQAYQLATFMAAAPLSLPVMRLLQRLMLPESHQAHLAEFFLSGLIRRKESDNGSASYEFLDGILELLILDAPKSDTIEVLKSFTNFIDRHTGQPIDFGAVVANPNLLRNIQLGSDSNWFATIGVRVLSQLGGEYRVLAEQITKAFEENSPTNSELSRIGMTSDLDKKTNPLEPGFNSDDNEAQKRTSPIKKTRSIPERTRQVEYGPLKFSNRDVILGHILNNSHNRIVVDAPVGYGKTRLLEEAKIRLQKKGWRCGIVSFSHKREQNKILREIRKDIAQSLGLTISSNLFDSDDGLVTALKGLPQFALMFDSVEFDSSGRLVAWLQQEIVAPIVRAHKQNFQFIFAGRHIQRMGSPYTWQGYKSEILLAIRVEHIVEVLMDSHTKYLKRHIKSSIIHPKEFQIVAENIAWISAGHPGSIQSLVYEWLDQDCSPDFSLQNTPNRLQAVFKRHVHPYVDKIRVGLGDELFSLTKTVSVFRMMDANVLRELQSAGEIGDYQPVWSKILALRLFLKRGGYWVDGVARQLVARDLEFLQPDEYHRLHGIARHIWEGQLSQMVIIREDFPNRDALLVDVLRNIIYHAVGEGLDHESLLKCICRNLLVISPKFDNDIDRLINLYDEADFKENDLHDDSGWIEYLEIRHKFRPSVQQIRDYLQLRMISDLDRQENSFGNAVFVSYAWGGDSERVVDDLEKAFSEHSIGIIRDKKDLDYKGSIKAFEQRIGQGQCIVLVISDKYLRSEHCMNELLELDINGELRERVFPIVLSDARIYKANDRLNYIKYWDEKIEKLNQSIKQIGVMANVDGIIADLIKYASIRASFDHLTDILKDMNALTPELHAANGFSTLISKVEHVVAGE